MNEIVEDKQYKFSFISEIHKEIEGIELGVLEGGIPYLSQRGLVTMAGISRKQFQALSLDWSKPNHGGNPHAGKIQKLLQEHGYNENDLFIEVKVSGKTTYAYTEPVCLAILEYYAYEAPEDYKSEKASTNYRKLSKAGFKSFVYTATGYVDKADIENIWQYFHDRVELTEQNVPPGYFCIFMAIAGLTVTLIRKGLPVNDEIIPDISVGTTWANYWRDNNLEKRFGPRIPYDHNYPTYYRQSPSNPQRANAYPEKAYGEFLEWFRLEYLSKKFPKYIFKRENLLEGGIEQAQAIVAAVSPPQIEGE